jgi:flavin-dependent dehydrogenase
VVIGAGPGGAAAATVLAEHGRRVAIVEREQFPRYRVGESLIPHCYFPLERLGVLDTLRRADFALEKHSVQFVTTEGEVVTPFYFHQHTDHPCATTWQVRRADFDQMLLDNAVDRGAELFMPARAKDVIRSDSGVEGVRADYGGDSIELRAPITLDASGRNLFSVSKTDWREADPTLRKVAVWTYYKGAKRDDGLDAGATTIAYIPEKGWFWNIPLPDDITSIGVVADREYLYRDGLKGDPKAIFDREAAIQPWIADRIAGAECVGEHRVTGDYSYRSRHSAENGLVLVGDAFAFLDPVFSSGVYLALRSGVLAGDAAHDALALGDVSSRAFESYSDRLCHEIESMRGLVFAFYDRAFSFGSLIKAHPELRSDLTECLIGNLNRDFSELFAAVGELAALPGPLPYGRPLVRKGA